MVTDCPNSYPRLLPERYRWLARWSVAFPDKPVDELARGKAMEKMLRTQFVVP
jgi:hypothetical protein